MRFASAVIFAVLLSACVSGSAVTRGDGASLASIAGIAATSGLRIAVAPILDKTGPQGTPGLSALTERYALGHEQADRGITGAVRDMLVTELFAVSGFIVVDREMLDAVRAEAMYNSGAGEPALLEGADLLLVGALTSFEPDAGGGALPLPVPVGGRGDFGVLRLALRKGVAALDLRIVDARTGRVVRSVAVEGKASKFAMNFDLHIDSGRRGVKLPGVLSYFQNTPLEAALQEMIIKAVASLSETVAVADNPEDL